LIEVLLWKNIIGFIAFILNVWGNLSLTAKRRDGWYVRIISIILWGVYAYNTASLPMIANSITFLCINIYGLHKWKKEGSQ
jgi:hypothetical protein